MKTIDLREGKAFELSLLCFVINDGSCGYDSFKNCVCRVRKMQKWNVSDPSTKFANNLHALVALALGLDDWSDLEIHNALGTSLDYHHGVDFFFVFGGKIITIDLTTNEDKIFAKADFVLQKVVVENESYLKEFAQEVAVEFGGKQ